MAQDLTQETVSSRIEEIVSRQIGSDALLSPETHLREELGMDSLEIVELGVTLEHEFHVAVPDVEVRRCMTLNDITRLILRTEPEEEVRSV